MMAEEVQPIAGVRAPQRRYSGGALEINLGRAPPPLPASAGRNQTPPRLARAASALELQPAVAADGANLHGQEVPVVAAKPVDPQASSNDGVTVVPVLERTGSTLRRTMSAVQVARPVVAHNTVPMLSCHCPNADDLPDGCEKCVVGQCALLAYLFYGAIVVFASWSTTKVAMAAGWYDPTGWLTSLLTIGFVMCLGCLCAGLAKVANQDEDEIGHCCLGFFALAMLSSLLCFAVSPPLAENWHMANGASPVRFVDPELAVGERSAYTGKDADLVASCFGENGRLRDSSGGTTGIFDAPVDVDPSRKINTQDDYKEIEFALSSYVDTSLSVPIFFDDEDDTNLDSDLDSVHIPQLCVAPVLRTCDVLPGGAPWHDVARMGQVWVQGVGPLDSSGSPSTNPSINQGYCDARRHDTQQPCSFWDKGLNCSAGASHPVELWVNFFMYVKVDKARGKNLRETCARSWQWAFEESEIEGGTRAGEPSAYKAEPDDKDSKDVWYPQPEMMGVPTDPGIFKLPKGMESQAQDLATLVGNPAPLTGHSTCICSSATGNCPPRPPFAVET